MLAQSAKLEAHNHWVRSAFERKQPRRLLLALVLLLVALTLVVVKDREYWFGSDDVADVDSAPVEPANLPAAAPSSIPSPVPSSVPNALSQVQSAPAVAAKKQIAAKSSTAKPSTEWASTTETAAANGGVVATNRTVLAPLAVEVVAGDTHRTLRPGSNVVKVEIPNSQPNSDLGSAKSASLASSTGSAPATNAAELERMSPGIATAIDQAGNSYPLLAQRARVEGSVVLQALIGADGVIRDLRVLSGPSILATAAQQAVRQWRFKPYLQNGHAVETSANITVSFTIKVSDNSKTS